MSRKVKKELNKNILEDEKFLDTLQEVKDFFEQNFVKKKDFTNRTLIALHTSLSNSGIQYKIRILSDSLRKMNYKLTTPFTQSLNKNIIDYIKMGPKADRDNLKTKKKMIFYAFKTFIYSVEGAYSYQKYLQCTNPNKKAVLAVSLIDKFKDTVYANDEIEKIKEVCEADDSLFVFIVHGCTFKVFTTLLKEGNFDIVHLAGHGAETNLNFMNEKIGYKRFVNAITSINKQSELYFLNCCDTYGYVKEKTLPFVNYTISYQGTLDEKFAPKLNACFYTHYLVNREIPSVWKEVEKEMKDQEEMKDCHFLSV